MVLDHQRSLETAIKNTEAILIAKFCYDSSVAEL